MRFQVKPRIMALVIRGILPILSMSGSSPETAAMNHAMLCGRSLLITDSTIKASSITMITRCSVVTTAASGDR